MSEDVTYSQLGPTSLNAGLGSEAVFENGEPEVNKKSVTAGLTVYYSLPKNRFLNYVRLFMAIQLCLIVSLYCAASAKDGWDSVDSVFPNSFSELTVDVVLLVLCEFIFTLVLHWRLESLTIRLANQPFDSHTRSRKTWLHLVDFAMATFVFGYSAVKAVFVWKDDWRHASYDRETEAWNNVSVSMLAIIIFCSFCHILISVALVWKLREIFTMVQNPKNVHFYNKRGVEVDENGRSLLLSRRTKSGSKLYRVAALAYPEWKLLTLGTLCLAAASTSSLLMPFYFGKIIDDSLDPDNDNLTDSIVMLTVIACAGSIFAVVRGWAFNLAGYRLVSQMREDLFQAIVRQDIGFFDSSRVGELTSRLSSDTQVIQSSITVNISMVLRYTIQIVASVAVMFWLSAPLTGVLLAVVPLVAVGAAQYGRFYARKVKYFQDALGVANTTAEECISNVRTIRSFACDEKACEKYNQDISVSLSIGKTLSLIYGAFQGLVSLLIQCALVLVLWYGSKLVSDHSKNPKNGISIGDLSSFMMYSVGVAMAFAFLSSIFGDMMKAVGASTRLFQLVDRQPAIQETGVVRIPQSQLDARVDFDCVAFAYPIRPNKNVLQDISFSVQAGQTVALVGPSGGGKSTCINLLLHFYEPHSGTIKFGGVDIRELEWAWYHENVAVVSQEPVLFGYSVKDNIAFGKGASQEEVVEAAKLANAHEFISNLEHGYDTLVGEKGVRLSGGQKQRVAIARALIMNPRVLLLDEATSALDAESEAIVKDAIDRAMKNRTVLVIAHRLSTVKHADLVIVIENGTIAEKGSHEDLLEKNGIYKKLVINQLMTPNVEDNLENVLKVNDLALSSSSQTTAEVNDRITPFDEHVNATNSDKF